MLSNANANSLHTHAGLVDSAVQPPPEDGWAFAPDTRQVFFERQWAFGNEAAATRTRPVTFA